MVEQETPGINANLPRLVWQEQGEQFGLGKGTLSESDHRLRRVEVLERFYTQHPGSTTVPPLSLSAQRESRAVHRVSARADAALGVLRLGEVRPVRDVLSLMRLYSLTSDGQPGDFHAVYALDNGLLENRRQPPVLDGVIAGLARYDYDANGHYVVDGLGVRYLFQDSDSQEHIFSVAEGRANIDGFKVERTQSQRLRLLIDPDLQRVSSEPQVFNASGDGVSAPARKGGVCIADGCFAPGRGGAGQLARAPGLCECRYMSHPGRLHR